MAVNFGVGWGVGVDEEAMIGEDDDGAFLMVGFVVDLECGGLVGFGGDLLFELAEVVVGVDIIFFHKLL